ncbi:MAG: ABC transporter ATP-binding protein [Chloroflexales bacterium]|nr:ABC transporter ATP-binding protein [Chloroflexales bacterium]
MSDIAVQVENLSKCYKIGKRENYYALRDVLTDMMAAPFQAAAARLKGQPRDKQKGGIHWALDNICFEIRTGEIVGIIGRNGAGKSTLLKILSRITKPTTGRARIYGRVGSLLEVGTGFHPELTGRENIYLNGAILGMRRHEINRKFDEIVAFSEIDKYLDTPVKRYSSGMYVRLAFSVAAHLEPEILIVDEVLAVGDASFQQKCLGKIEGVAREGRTVLFVSHNMGAVRQLCTSAILLRQGQVVAQGKARKIVDDYLTFLSSSRKGKSLEAAPERSGDGRLLFTSGYLQNEANEEIETPIAGQPLNIVFEYIAKEDLSQVMIFFTIFNHLGVAVTRCHINSIGQKLSIPKGKGKIVCNIPRLPLPKGRYRVSLASRDNFDKLDLVPSACVFDVGTSTFFQTSHMPPTEFSTVLVDHSWEHIPVDE